MDATLSTFQPSGTRKVFLLYIPYPKLVKLVYQVRLSRNIPPYVYALRTKAYVLHVEKTQVAVLRPIQRFRLFLRTTRQTRLEIGGGIPGSYEGLRNSQNRCRDIRSVRRFQLSWEPPARRVLHSLAGRVHRTLPHNPSGERLWVKADRAARAVIFFWVWKD
jgi:hypothetical protein